MSLYTIFGGRGFIGSEFVRQLTKLGHDIYIPERNDANIYKKGLGTVIYAAGYGDCENNAVNVLEANTVLLNRILNNSQFQKIVYISSTRVYMGGNSTSEESNLIINFKDKRKLFNLTKLTSEEMCIKSGKECLIIRPSNVYGLALNSPLFLPSIIRDAINDQVVNMYVTPHYSKDYVHVGDVVSSTISLINKSQNGIFNIASGKNTNADSIANLLINKTGCKVNWLVENDIDFFSPIDISKIKSITDFYPSSVLDDINSMVQKFKISMAKKSVI
ncbi:SDR family oxidoreductase [Providencia sp. PROV137]|uniref:SDR family oxidoreductase n=1 Tax=Providencia sp. PROV137 TaxID=2949847 RepID=UPI00234953F3|nr:SDR family oxidoreductase [Providencia sp. PROV137]